MSSSSPLVAGVPPVVYIDPQHRIAELEAEVASLQAQNEALSVKANEYATFIRTLAERYFATDDRSRYFAGQAMPGEAIDSRAAYQHWHRAGGSDTFRRDFPSAETVIRCFRRLHDRRF